MITSFPSIKDVTIKYVHLLITHVDYLFPFILVTHITNSFIDFKDLLSLFLHLSSSLSIFLLPFPLLNPLIYVFILLTFMNFSNAWSPNVGVVGARKYTYLSFLIQPSHLQICQVIHFI